jgi:arginyl-tRNA synthetase
VVSRVTREYYFNDSGAQIRTSARRLRPFRRGEAVADDGYHGDYVHEPCGGDA